MTRTPPSPRWLPLLLLLLLLPSREVRADGYAGQAGAFLRMGSGANALATGDAGVARAMGAEQAHYNPAGLPFAPANDIYFAYQKLSFDRRLAHISALYQVPRIAFWGGPIRTLTARKPEAGETLPTLLYPDQLRRGSDIEIRTQDYLESLADAVVDELERATAGDDSGSRPIILTINGADYRAGSLEPIVRELAANAAKRHLSTPEEIARLIEEKYRRVQEKPAAIALSWTHAGTDNIESRDTDGNVLGSLGFFENRFALSFGLKFHRTFSAGVTLGVLYALVPNLLEDNSKALTSTTFGADAGIQIRPFAGQRMPFRLETLALGAAAYGLGGKNTWNTTGYWSLGTTKTDKYPKRYRAGLAYDPLPGVSTYLDLETDLDQLLRPKGGIEVRVWNGGFDSSLQSHSSLLPSTGSKTGLALRFGVDRDRPTFGLGLELPLSGLGATRLDYAYVVEPVSPEPTQVLSWRFRFTL